MPNYIELVSASGAGKGSEVDTVAAVESGRAIGAGKASQVDALTAVDTSSGIGAGKTSARDALSHAETVGATGAGSASERDTQKTKIRIAAKGAGVGSLLDVLAAVDAKPARGAGKASLVESAATYDETAITKGAGKSSPHDVFTGVDVDTATGAGKAGLSGIHRMHEHPDATGAGVASVTNDRVSIDVTPAKGASRSSAIDSGTFVEVVGVKGAGTASLENPAPDPSGLIPAIRYNLLSAIPSLTQIPEALPEEDLLTDATLPMGVIIAHAPTQDNSFGVFSQGQKIQVDLVYVRADAANTDVAQAMRLDLETVRRQMLSDYRMYGKTDHPACTNTDIVATPFDRANAYEQYVRSKLQAAWVLVLTIECTLVQSLVPKT